MCFFSFATTQRLCLIILCLWLVVDAILAFRSAFLCEWRQSFEVASRVLGSFLLRTVSRTGRELCVIYRAVKIYKVFFGTYGSLRLRPLIFWLITLMHWLPFTCTVNLNNYQVCLAVELIKRQNSTKLVDPSTSRDICGLVIDRLHSAPQPTQEPYSVIANQCNFSMTHFFECHPRAMSFDGGMSDVGVSCKW